jgi:ribulose-phosphate 3-epimerase
MQKTIDVHLMIVDPDRYIKLCRVRRKYSERTLRSSLHRTLQAIKAEGMKAGRYQSTYLRLTRGRN